MVVFNLTITFNDGARAKDVAPTNKAAEVNAAFILRDDKLVDRLGMTEPYSYNANMMNPASKTAWGCAALALIGEGAEVWNGGRFAKRPR